MSESSFLAKWVQKTFLKHPVKPPISSSMETPFLPPWTMTAGGKTGKNANFLNSEPIFKYDTLFCSS